MAVRGVDAGADIPGQANVAPTKEHGPTTPALLVHRLTVPDVGGLGVGAVVLRIGCAGDGKSGAVSARTVNATVLSMPTVLARTCGA